MENLYGITDTPQGTQIGPSGINTQGKEMTTYRATGSRFLIKKIEASKTTAMGIILQNSEDAPRAEIISVGPKVKSSAEVGDIIIVDWSRVGHVDGDIFIVAEDNVLAVVG
jgi:co-chaperonin GroES (HSP10)